MKAVIANRTQNADARDLTPMRGGVVETIAGAHYRLAQGAAAGLTDLRVEERDLVFRTDGGGEFRLSGFFTEEAEPRATIDLPPGLRERVLALAERDSGDSHLQPLTELALERMLRPESTAQEPREVARAPRVAIAVNLVPVVGEDPAASEWTGDEPPGAAQVAGPATVTAKDAGLPPVAIDNQQFSVDENKAAGTVVGTVAASHPTVGETLTYSIVGATLSGVFAIDSTTGELRVANPALLNYEYAPVQQVSVRVTDSAGLADTTTVRVNLIDQPDPALGRGQVFSVDENKAAGTVVGTVAAAGASLTYSIVGATLSGVFAIDSTTGELRVANPALLNYEYAPVQQVSVRVTDSAGLTDTTTVRVNLIDQPDPALGRGQVFSVDENKAAGTVVGTVAASHPTVGETLTYSIVGATLSGVFAIDSTTGELRVANPALLNYEYAPVQQVSVRVTDSAGLADTTTVRVNLIDQPDPALGRGQVFSVDENKAAGTVVGTVAAAGASLTYSIVGATLSGVFAIDSTTGELRVANPALLNYEYAPVQQVSVRVTDSAGLTDTTTVRVNLIDQPDPALGRGQVFSVDENKAAGTVVGTVAASHPTVGETLTYSIVGATLSGVFAIDSTTGELRVANPALLNYEYAPVQQVSVRVTDSAGLADTTTVRVNLIDQPDPALGRGQVFSVDENKAAGTVVGTVAAAGASLTYSIVGATLSGVFAIDSTTGELRVANPALLNYEYAPVQQVSVRVTDSAGLTDTTTVRVNLIDLNDSPVDAPVINSSSSLSVDENTTAVGTVDATDPDGDTLSYAITGAGDDDFLFQIDSGTGELSFYDAANFERPDDLDGDNVYEVEVTASDGDLVTTQTILVTVNDVPEMPVILSPTDLYATTMQTAVGQVEAVDDDGDTLTYSIIGGDDAALFGIDASTGELSFLAAPDYDNPADVGGVAGDNAYEVQVQVSDGTFDIPQNVTVHVSSIVFGSADSFSTEENRYGVGTVSATVPGGGAITYSILGGADADLFAIDASSGALVFVDKPDYERPFGCGCSADNVYQVQVGASDGSQTNAQTIEVTVTDLPDEFDLADLDGSNGFRIPGLAADDATGFVVSAAGDVNNDGYADILVGTPDPGCGCNGGTAYLIFGSAAGPGASLDLTALDGSNGFRIDRPAGDGFGVAMAGAGDVNGDGYDDLIVGAPGGRDANGFFSDPGTTYVIFGAAGGFDASFDLDTLDGSNGFSIVGEAAGDASGYSVSSAGDVNGDGFADLLIGAPAAGYAGAAFAGASYLVYGTDTGFDPELDLTTLDGSNGARLQGTGDLEGLGIAVSSAGDVNGDGYDDLLIGAAGDGVAGRAYVVFGSAAGIDPALDLATLDGSEGYRINGSDSDLLSTAISSAGDLNGDGFDDLLLGAPGHSPATLTPEDMSFSPGWHMTVIRSADPLLSLADADHAIAHPEDPILSSNTDAFNFGTGGNGEVADENPDGVDYNDEDNDNSVVVGEGEIRITTAGSWTFALGSDDGARLQIDLNRDGDYDDADETREFSGTGDHVAEFTFTAPGGYDIRTTVFNSVGDFYGELHAAQGSHLAYNSTDFRLVGDTDAGGLEINSAFTSNLAGAAYVIFGHAGVHEASVDVTALDGSNGFRIDGDSIGGSAGRAVSAAGDINGDGIEDILVGAPGNSADGVIFRGAVYVIYGSLDGFDADINLDDLDGRNGFRVLGSADYEYAGASVSGAGDVNGDGLDDLLIGSPGAFPTGTYAGDAAVFYGFDPTGRYNLVGDMGASFVIIGPSDTGILALGGDDTVYGHFGDNVINLGDGNDTAVGFNGNDRLIGGAGNDTLLGDEDDDTLLGGDGDDYLYGGANADRLLGGAGVDYLTGDAGDDRLHGGSGVDELQGGADNDVLSYDAVDTLVDGGSGIDALTLSNGDSLDFTAIAQNVLLGIEVIDLKTDAAANTVILSINDVLDMSDSDALVIGGDSNDQALLDASFVDAGPANIGGLVFDSYVAGGATVYVEQGIPVNFFI
ncbi:hypothetical protein D0B54_24000 [Solimonas sp. K1W22B-7]|uniref:cadherin domain-containing protein n=1 Tax=Solimonas sp. K1W22B-7 TaxID=2303331 RepID=UPI000E331C6E|nr:cadherin domain-containing protein [Solimonas sp. K1W22B-7]AXQ31561.1 hypothetical protein D0B54_24000 [Solimonas sp. K1W22B-7]